MEHRLLHTEIRNTPCPECKAQSFPVTLESMSNYFNGIEMTCSQCGTKLDWWNLLLRHFDWEVPTYLYSIVGGFTTSLMIDMKVNETFMLDLGSIGIPEDSKILQINYTANGKGLLPIEVHGNTPLRHIIPKKIRLFGMPSGEPAESTPIAIQFYWVHKSNDNELWENLIESVESFTLKDYKSCIIPSNVAVEAMLTKIISSYLSLYAAKDRVNEFLNDGAAYSHQLNVLLPLIANHETFPKLPDHIRGSLNELRGLRNDLAHEGRLEGEIAKKDISRLICASAFGLSYLILLKDHLESKKK